MAGREGVRDAETRNATEEAEQALRERGCSDRGISGTAFLGGKQCARQGRSCLRRRLDSRP